MLAVNLIGRQIGSYVVERELGAGGTGTVYLCSHTMIDRKVAVKVLHDELAYQPDQVARFFQEAKAAADIGHPNIVVIIDFGSIPVPGGTRSYLMMECLDGSSLDKRLRTERFTLEQIAHILSQICSALAASHGKGIIHRDLKPANVQLCPRSFDPTFVKLLDFGIAKLATPGPDAHKTQYGVVIGTPAYMSPEQCEGKGILDHRSDIYSLGVMLYELLTGTLPFDGEIRDILMGHLTVAPPSARERNPGVPLEWEALCMHMMEKSRDARFQSVSEIAQALFDLPRHASAYSSYVIARSSTGHSGHTMRLDASPDPRETAARPTLNVGLESGIPPALGMIEGGSPERSRPTDSSEPVLFHPSVQYFTPAQLDALANLSPPLPPMQAPPLATSSYVVGPGAMLPLPGRQGLPGAQGAYGGSAGSNAYEGPPTGDTGAGMAACYALATEPRHSRFLATLLVRPPGRWADVAELCSTSNTAPPATLPPLPLFCTWLDHPWADPGMVAVIFVSLNDGSNTVALCRRASW
jgi:serine/threonine protein kinase